MWILVRMHLVLYIAFKVLLVWHYVIKFLNSFVAYQPVTIKRKLLCLEISSKLKKCLNQKQACDSH